MNFVREIGLVMLLAALAVAGIGAIVWCAGLPFELSPRMSVGIGVIAVFFWLPALLNVHIAANAPDGERAIERSFAALRAFGMLLCSAAILSRGLVPDFHLGHVSAAVGVGAF